MLTGCHTCFQQHYLIILTQLHEAVDALGELHHILNGLRYFDSAQLPHDFPGLGADRTEDGVFLDKKKKQVPLATDGGRERLRVPCSGSSPPPPAGRPARSSAAAPPSDTDTSPCATWRCSGPGALQNNTSEEGERKSKEATAIAAFCIRWLSKRRRCVSAREKPC